MSVEAANAEITRMVIAENTELGKRILELEAEADTHAAEFEQLQSKYRESQRQLRHFIAVAEFKKRASS